MSDAPSKNPIENPSRPKNNAPKAERFGDEILPDAATAAIVRNQSFGAALTTALTTFAISGVDDKRQPESPKSATPDKKPSALESAIDNKATGTVKADGNSSVTLDSGIPKKMDFAHGAAVKFECNNPEKPDEVTDLEYKDPKNPSLDMHLSRLSGVQTREHNGVIREINDPKRNYHWQHQPNGDWTLSPLNPRDRFAADRRIIRGNAERTLSGGYSFIDEYNNRKYQFKADGSEDVVKHGTIPGKDPGTSVTYKDGIEQEMRFKSGSTAIFKHDNAKAPNEITNLEFKDGSKGSTKLTRVPGQENQFTDGKYTYSVNYETKDGQLIISQPKEGLVQYQGIDGYDRQVDTKTGIETIERDGSIETVSDPKRNYLWQHQATGDWKVEALDKTKPFAPPSEKVTGKFEKLADRSYQFVTADGISHRFKADGSHDVPGDMKDLRDRISQTSMLTKEQKDRLLNDYLPKFAARNIVGKSAEEAKKEKNETIAQLSTLLEKPLPGAYADAERAKILEQTSFHLGYETNFGQHLNTCNVTDLGVVFAHESPLQLARVMAEVGNTGQFCTKDGSIIVPPKEDIQDALNSQSFPLDQNDPRATGVSRAFAIIAANISWQRREVEPLGRVVAKGSLKYHQTGGEGVFHHENGLRYHVTNEENTIITNPYLSIGPLLDIAEQITGVAWQNKFIEAKPFYDRAEIGNPNTLGFNKHKLATSVDSPVALHNAFMKNQIQIANIYSGNPPFYYDSGYGADAGAGGPNGDWHVVVKTHYEPVFDANNRLDINKSMVYIDNTWNPHRADRLTKETAIPLSTFYNAMFKP